MTPNISPPRNKTRTAASLVPRVSAKVLAHGLGWPIAFIIGITIWQAGAKKLERESTPVAITPEFVSALNRCEVEKIREWFAYRRSTTFLPGHLREIRTDCEAAKLRLRDKANVDRMLDQFGQK